MALETGRPFTNPSYFGNEISLRGEHSEALRLAFELIPLGVIYWSAQDLRTILGDGGGFCLGTTRTSESWPGLAARRKRCPVRRLRLRPALIWSNYRSAAPTCKKTASTRRTPLFMLFIPFVQRQYNIIYPSYSANII